MRIACKCCGNVLTDEERRWYGSTCEQCEQEWHARIEAWRHGGEDKELDALYDVPRPTSH